MGDCVSIINKRNASQMIIDYILDQIQKGYLKRGDKLMTEQEFSELLGVSRIPLREALCALSTVGILESRQGGGTYVSTKSDPSMLGRMLYDYALLDNVDLRQVIDVRLLLEPEAARQAAIQSSQRQREEIWALAEEYRELMEHYAGTEADNRKTMRLDRQLHQAVAQASHHDFLRMVLSITGTSFAELNNRNYLLSNDQGAKERKAFSQHHTELAQAILSSNAPAAYKAMEKHLQHIKRAHMADIDGFSSED
jgi:GntR family transcriptional repressor for pyruvate dehydrogenase complex